MNILASFVPCRLEDLHELREQYLDQLLAAQEALLEMLVCESYCFAIVAKQRTIGYFLLHEREGLVEYHVTPATLPFAHLLLRKFVSEKAVRSALIKSFDHLFLACAVDVQTSVKVRGILVRDFAARELPVIASIKYRERLAEEGDLARVCAVDQSVFTNPERLLAVIRLGAMRLFEREEQLVGFGIIRPVIAGRAEVDLGLVVDAAFRNKGYAAYLLRDLAQHCLRTGLVPIAGCSAQNEPSIRLGLRVGFVSRYRLLELGFAAAPGESSA